MYDKMQVLVTSQRLQKRRIIMFKKLTKYVALTRVAGMLAACGNNSAEKPADSGAGKDGNVKIDTLSVGFVPSKDPEDIKIATEPLEGLIIDEMKNHGYDISNVEITVGTSYEAVGES